MKRNKKALLSVILAGVLVFALAVPGLPAAQAVEAGKVIYVRANNVAEAGIYVTPNGESWATAYPELQDALDDALAAQIASPGLTVEIRVAAGTYYPTSDNGIPAPDDYDQEQMYHFRLRNNVTIYGGYPADGGNFVDRDFELHPSILSGNIDSEGSYDCLHVFYNNGTDSTAILDGFTITGGNANGAVATGHFGGGGMCNFNSSPTLNNIIFEGNYGDYGGGMLNGSSNPALTSVNFAGNRSVKGGGMYNLGSSPTLHFVIFDNNLADHTNGGGMYNEQSNAVLNDVVFADNYARLNGGGMCNFDSSPVLNQVFFADNEASLGGGMYNSQSNPSLTDVTFTGNWAENGGGMYNDECSSSLTTVSFEGNFANTGGGMYNDESNPTLSAVDFFGNAAGEFSVPTAFEGFEGGIASTYEEGLGGGLYNEYSDPVLSDVTFEGNSAFLGGGMANVNSFPSVSDVTFTDNDAFMGGGAYNGYYESSEPSAGIMGEAPPIVFTDVVFTNNEAGFGGAMLNDMEGPSITLVRAVFTGNIGYMFGGAIANASDLTIEGATFTGNSAGYDSEDGGGGAIYNIGMLDAAKAFFLGNYAELGGAIYAENSGSADVAGDETTLPAVSIVNSVFSCNYAYEGGAIFSASDLSLLNSTFSGNDAMAGGGLCAEYGSAEVVNCIFWGNTAGECDPQVWAVEAPVLISYSLIEGAYADGWNSDLGIDGGNNIDADPLFQRNPSMGDYDIDFGDLSLRSGSPARDKGNNSAVTGITKDIIGNRRIANGRVDMGAYEYPVAPPPPPPAPEPELRRLGGPDRFGTAVEVSKAGWDTAALVIVARSDDYADALTGVPLAFLKDAPILLTRTNTLPIITKAEIQRLGAVKVIILGGPAAVSQAVETELRAMGLTVERVWGSNRFGTAAKIADLIAPDGNSQVALANGWDFPDALSVAPYAAKLGMPILLTTTGAIPAETLTALNKLEADEVFIVGGTAVISQTSVAGLSGTVRISDTDRYGTAIELAKYFNPAADKIFIATGLKFPDCLTGAVLAANEDCGILLVGSTLPASVAEYLAGKNIMYFTVLGGTAAVSTAVAGQLIN